MLLTILSFLAFIVVIAYFAIRKKETKLKDYEITQTEIKHVIADVDPIVFEEEQTPEPIVEKKPKKAASKKSTVKKTKATKNGK